MINLKKGLIYRCCSNRFRSYNTADKNFIQQTFYESPFQRKSAIPKSAFVHIPHLFVFSNNPPTFAALKSWANKEVLDVAATYLAYHESKIIISKQPSSYGYTSAHITWASST